MKLLHPQWRVAALMIGLSVILVSDTETPYSPHEKAAFLEPNVVNFVRPGLVLKITSAKIASDGTITTTFSVADPKGLPLDADGINTPGTLSIGYVAATIPQSQDEYTAYTTSAASGPAVPATQRPAADSGGVRTMLAPGEYQYVFKTKAPTGFDATATHTIGIYASRVLTEFDMPNNFASAVYNFVPNGAKVTKTRDLIKTASCNACHDQLSFHGGRRRGVEMCVLCHTTQNVDTVNGGSLDLQVMAHRIHMGSQLPSVVAGKPNKVVNVDFSDVVYPADPRRCESCHKQDNGAAQAKNYMTNPTRAACGACHDDVNFATGEKHAGGPQVSDKLCATCHIPQGEIDFDASIKGAHAVPTESRMLSGLNVNLVKVENGVAGKAPAVTFTVKDNAGKPIPMSQLGSISLVLAGPTSDYGYTSFGSDVTTPGYVSESVIAAPCAADGTCLYQFTHAVPAKATGTYAIGVQSRRTEVLLKGTTAERSVQYGAANKIIYFPVDNSPVAPRRKVVTMANCNRCHVALALHGAQRFDPEFCEFCHNPSNTDAARRPMSVVPADRTLPPQGINFALMVHRIHNGEHQVEDGRTYIVVGNAGSHNDFTDVNFPAMSPTGATKDLRNCSICHTNGSEQVLPVGRHNVIDPQGPITPNGATSSACTGCHTSLAAASHTLLQTSPLGESCTVCHNAGADFAVNKSHAQY